MAAHLLNLLISTCNPDVTASLLFQLPDRPAYGVVNAFRDGADIPYRALHAARGAAGAEGSPSYSVGGFERLADKFVLMRFGNKHGASVAAIAYWFERPESSGRPTPRPKCWKSLFRATFRLFLHRSLNQRVVGSSPTRPTSFSSFIAPTIPAATACQSFFRFLPVRRSLHAG